MSTETERRVALVVVAHPDDAEFAAAGTVATWVNEGWEVYYVLCTDGSGGGSDLATDVGPQARRLVVEERQREQRAAAAVLGVKEVFFLGYPDGQLQPSLELRRDLVRLMRRYKPSRVICQSPDRSWTPALVIQRYHPDHLAAGRATLEAVYPACQNPWDFPELLQEEGLPPHKINELYIVSAPVQNFAVDISPLMERKLDALRAHASQLSDHFEELQQMLLQLSAEAGKPHGFQYAEEFHRVVIQ